MAGGMAEERKAARTAERGKREVREITQSLKLVEPWEEVRASASAPAPPAFAPRPPLLLLLLVMPLLLVRSINQ